MLALIAAMGAAHVPALVLLFMHSLRAVGQTAQLIVVTLLVLAWLMVTGAVFVALIGDLLRVHARATSAHARYACPNCGYGLRGRLAEAEVDDTVQCPECAEWIEAAISAPPYPLSRRFTSWGRWSPRMR